MSAAEDVLLELLHMEVINTFVNENKDKEDAACKLEYMGFSTGYRFVERATRENNRFKDELDIMKYICKVFWVSIFKKEIDNLRTNHQGVYVLNDNNFRFLSRIAAGKQYLQCAPRFVAFTCGLIRGGLANLGINCVVTAEVNNLPACKFQVQVQRG
ncbi:UNVERIFIED_CONTAM: hypothetical protein GTU68_016419 [Idotea baltica]|nr:hypothetical protein [Idotea baltica]